MLMENGKYFSTGNQPVETLLPLHHMLEAGYGVDVATLSGGPGKFEWWAHSHDDEAVASAWESTEAAFKYPRRLADVIANGLDDYAAIFIPGGHGAMNVIPFAEDVQAALDHFQNDDKLIITLGHDRGLAAGRTRNRQRRYAGSDRARPQPPVRRQPAGDRPDGQGLRDRTAGGVRRVAPPARRFRSSARFTVGT